MAAYSTEPAYEIARHFNGQKHSETAEASKIEDMLYREGYERCAGCGTWSSFVADEYCEPCSDEDEEW